MNMSHQFPQHRLCANKPIPKSVSNNIFTLTFLTSAPVSQQGVIELSSYFMLLFFISTRYVYDLYIGNYTRIDQEMNTTDSLIIRAHHPLMSINVVQAENFRIQQSLNENYKKIEFPNSSNITFFDFGIFSGQIEFFPLNLSRLILEVFLFPNECNTARIVTNQIPFVFELTKSNVDPYFRIANDQIFCIWHVFQGPRNVSINMMTEEIAETFKQMRESNDILTLSGTKELEIQLNSSEYWFKWRTDPSELSDYLGVHFTSESSNESDSSFFKFFSVATNYTSEVFLSKGNVSYEVDTDTIDNTDGLNRKVRWTTIIIWVIVAIIFIVVVGVTVCIFLKKCYKGKFELMDDFTFCILPETLPQPISYNI